MLFLYKEVFFWHWLLLLLLTYLIPSDILFFHCPYFQTNFMACRCHICDGIIVKFLFMYVSNICCRTLLCLKMLKIIFSPRQITYILRWTSNQFRKFLFSWSTFCLKSQSCLKMSFVIHSQACNSVSLNSVILQKSFFTNVTISICYITLFMGHFKVPVLA